MTFGPFFHYFWRYLFFSKTRQKLLILAMSGLLLSSFALMSIQGLMGGLQRSLVQRSKEYFGYGVIELVRPEGASVEALIDHLTPYKKEMTLEWEIELLARHKNFVSPVILHGVDYRFNSPFFLKNRDSSQLVLGADLAHKLKVRFLDDVQVFSPAMTDSLMGEIPRHAAISVSDYLLSEVQDIDQYHAWVRLGFLQNFLREKKVNRIRFFSEDAYDTAQKYLEKYPTEDYRALSWEDQHQTLVFALNLETRVMMFLFMSMSFLIAIAITTGLLIFYRKVRRDLASFWILGASQKQVERASFAFICFLSAVVCLLGILLSVGALLILEYYGHRIIPDLFVERSLPVQFKLTSFLLAFFIPYLISVIFSYLSFHLFRREQSHFLELLRMN